MQIVFYCIAPFMKYRMLLKHYCQKMQCTQWILDMRLRISSVSESSTNKHVFHYISLQGKKLACELSLYISTNLRDGSINMLKHCCHLWRGMCFMECVLLSFDCSSLVLYLHLMLLFFRILFIFMYHHVN